MGLMFPTSGSARILGREINDPVMKAQIGFLPEQPYFYDYLTASELLQYYGRLSGIAAKDLNRRVHQMLHRVGLPEAGGVQLRKFSKGMLQRVGIAQAILHDPKVVFFDEPMSGLDPMGRREVRDLMEQLKHEGKTVFFSTHILSDAEALCDRVAILNKGELRGVGAVADLTSSVDGKVEVVWQDTRFQRRCGRWGRVARHRRQGSVVVADTQSGHCHRRSSPGAVRLVAVAPVRTSLEAYFVEKLQPSRIYGGDHGMSASNRSDIASNTFREAVRDRVLYNLIAFALLLSGALPSLSARSPSRSSAWS